MWRWAGYRATTSSGGLSGSWIRAMISASSVDGSSSTGWGYRSPQRRPPLRLAFGLESPGIDSGQDIPGREAFLDCGETDPARHHQVGPDVDLTEETAVYEPGARVLPGVTGAKTDLVEGIEICWLDRTDQHVLPGRIWRRTGPAGANPPYWSA